MREEEGGWKIIQSKHTVEIVILLPRLIFTRVRADGVRPRRRVQSAPSKQHPGPYTKTFLSMHEIYAR